MGNMGVTVALSIWGKRWRSMDGVVKVEVRRHNGECQSGVVNLGVGVNKVGVRMTFSVWVKEWRIDNRLSVESHNNECPGIKKLHMLKEGVTYD